MAAAEESSSATTKRLLDKLDRVQTKLAEIERKKSRIDERQDHIDHLAIRTLCAMNHLHGRIQTYQGVYDLDKDLVVSRSAVIPEVFIVDTEVQTEGLAAAATATEINEEYLDDGDDEDDDSDTFASESLGKYESDVKK